MRADQRQVRKDVNSLQEQKEKRYQKTKANEKSRQKRDSRVSPFTSYRSS